MQGSPGCPSPILMVELAKPKGNVNQVNIQRHSPPTTALAARICPHLHLHHPRLSQKREQAARDLFSLGQFMADPSWHLQVLEVSLLSGSGNWAEALGLLCCSFLFPSRDNAHHWGDSAHRWAITRSDHRLAPHPGAPLRLPSSLATSP